MQKISRRLTAAILSISLLTVMAGAAVAPALGAVKAHFADSPGLLVQLVVSIPALFIILTNMAFPTICRVARTRTIAVVGLLMYVICGSGAFFADDMAVLLTSRALLGVSVGLIMPLSTGLLSYYYPPEAQARLMGLSAAMNQMGGVVATLLAGLLAEVAWNCAFLVYLLGLVAVVLVMAYLPSERLAAKGRSNVWATLRHFHPSVAGMLLLMCIFFIYPANFAITAAGRLSTKEITLMMVGLDVVAFGVGMCFGSLMHRCRKAVKYFAPLLFAAGFGILANGSDWMHFVAGSALVGLANGVGIPYLNTIASIKGGRDAAATVMPLLSSSLYLGQFISPIVVSVAGRALFGADQAAPYKVGAVLSLIFLMQAFLTRNAQALPPADEDK